MGVCSKIKSKIKEGAFREMLRETRWMYTYVRRFKTTVLIHILLGVVGTVMSLLSSLAMRELIDVVTGYQAGAIWSAAAYMAGMLLGSVFMQAAASRIAAVINIRVQNDIQAEVYDRMLRTDWQALEKFRSGDLINRLNGDVGTVSSGITSLIPSLVSGSVQFLGALIIILCCDPVMALIALIAAPVYVLSSRALIKRMREYNKRMKEVGSEAMSFHEDSFRNLTGIKSFGIMDGFNERMRRVQNTYKEALLDYNKFSVVTGFVMSIVGLVISAGCFGWGVYRLWTNAISFGTMTMFLQLTNMLRSSFSSLVGLVPSTISITTSAGRLMAVVELPEEPGARERIDLPSECGVELRNVSFSYEEDEPVLRNISFSVKPGEFVALMGASGEGKTTVVRLMLGLIRPKSGAAILLTDDGEIPISAATRRAFAYVPQGNTVLAGTIADNLRMVKPDATDTELMEALHLACADKFVSRLPKGIYSQTGETGRGFSEGQAQRIAVARALLQKAPILILDEATSALDGETEMKMLLNIRNSGFVKTCVLISHRPAAAGMCEKRYVLDGLELAGDEQ